MRVEDAVVGLRAFARDADLVFIDAEKRDYEAYLELAVAALRPGGLLIADNLTSHAGDLEGFRTKALLHERLTGLVVPIGKGELVGVRLAD